MEKHKRNTEQPKQRILDDARVLFAQYGINGVSIRDIARRAETSHPLIIHYFGSKLGIAGEVLRREVAEYAGGAGIKPGENVSDTLASVREYFVRQLANPDLKISMQTVFRAEMDGLAPERDVPPGMDRFATRLTQLITYCRGGAAQPDARYTAAVILSSMYTMVLMSPWLLDALGLPAEDADRFHRGVVDILVGLIALPAGLAGGLAGRTNET